MTLEEYAATVEEMRLAQSEFFRHRVDTPARQIALKRARSAEARVDKATQEILEGQRVLSFGPDEKPTPPAPRPAA